MSKKKAIDFDAVAKMGLALPGATEGIYFRVPALFVGGKMFATTTSHKSAEPETLAIRMSFEQRDELIAADPATYYLKEHYASYPCVLVRLRVVHPDALRDLLRMGWEFTSAKSARRKSPAAPRRSARATPRPRSRRTR